MSARHEALESTVRDHSWWNESVDNLVFDFDPQWATDNIAAWLNQNFNVSRTFVLGPGQRPLHATLGSEPVATDSPAWRRPAFRDLIGHVMSGPDDPAASHSAYIEFADGIHLVAASKPLLEAGATGHPPYPGKGVLVITPKRSMPACSTRSRRSSIYQGSTCAATRPAWTPWPGCRWRARTGYRSRTSRERRRNQASGCWSGWRCPWARHSP